ncbi:hypothetical protein KQ693_05940 [Thermus sp. PS18]|uniref:hypothetical protein n=1 Tax=Thermus sp. PS18 TaxID=2849039 RepID=UPI0022643F34|nr:hypothetical protein [Thermus sp. PS18]UZX16570.1 hypothetical protein KQ693_05940 [Thermus sp. PS18]
MSVDVLKLLLLLFGALQYGAPNSWDTAVQLKLSVALPGPTGAVELAVDPVPIYYRSLPGNLCGDYVGVVVVDPRAEEKGCRDTLAHELNHVWQARAWGLLQPLTYPFSPGLWEPVHPWEGAGGMPAPRSLNWPLIRLWVPLEP